MTDARDPSWTLVMITRRSDTGERRTRPDPGAPTRVVLVDGEPLVPSAVELTGTLRVVASERCDHQIMTLAEALTPHVGEEGPVRSGFDASGGGQGSTLGNADT